MTIYVGKDCRITYRNIYSQEYNVCGVFFMTLIELVTIIWTLAGIDVDTMGINIYEKFQKIVKF